MTIIRVLLISAAMIAVVALSASADDTKEKTSSTELKNQTHCPVMGGKIDSAVYTDIQGHRVYHCCPMCSNKLKADPDKYFGKAAEEGVLFENIQTTCPVSGEELEEKATHADYNGRRVYFCSETCRDTFEKDPEKVLGKLDAPVKAKEHKSEDHSGHNH